MAKKPSRREQQSKTDEIPDSIDRDQNKREMEAFIHDVVSDDLPISAFKKIGSLFSTFIAALLPKSSSARKARLERKLANTIREGERIQNAHRKVRIARGLSPKAGEGKPEPRILFDAQKEPTFKLPKNPVYGDYVAAKAIYDREIRANLPLGASRFGGLPDLPPQLPWPEHEGKKLPFLSQVDLSTLPPDRGQLLPHDGWLYAFGHIQNGTEDGTEPLIVTLHAGPRSALVRRVEPLEDEIWEHPDDLVPLFVGKDQTDIGDDEDDDDDRGQESGGWLFGDVSTAFTPVGEIADRMFQDGDDWINLLAIKSVGSMQWSDCGHLYLLIRREHLMAKDFSRVIASIESS